MRQPRCSTPSPGCLEWGLIGVLTCVFLATGDLSFPSHLSPLTIKSSLDRHVKLGCPPGCRAVKCLLRILDAGGQDVHSLLLAFPFLTVAFKSSDF